MPEERRPLNDYAMGPFEIADIDTASAAVYMQPAPYTGQIVGIKCVSESATTGATASGITVEKNGVAMTGITLAVVAGDAKDVHTNYFSPNLVTGNVQENDCIQVKTDGLGDTGGKASVYLIIRR